MAIIKCIGMHLHKEYQGMQGQKHLGGPRPFTVERKPKSQHFKRLVERRKLTQPKMQTKPVDTCSGEPFHLLATSNLACSQAGF
jgi:hypothetical protein